MYRKFCLFFILFSICSMAIIAGLNVIVDPYEIWEKVKIVGFNMYPTKAEELDRMQKPIHLLNMENKPEVVFLGTSQVLYAMDMDVYQELTGKSAYNFSMWGATLYEQRKALEHVIALDDNLKDIYIGLSFAGFVQGDHHPLHRAEDFFKNEEAQYGKSYIIPNTIARTLLSWDATKESIKTIRDNHKNRWTSPCFMYSGKRIDDGLLRAFQADQWKFNRTFMLMARNGHFRNIELSNESFQELQTMIELCQEKGVAIHLYIPVAHARQLELFANEWDVYEEWKRQLVRMAPIIDFTTYNEITMSEAKGGVIQEDTNPYFWDAMHFKNDVGTAMMLRLIGRALPAGKDFGVLLTDENIEKHLMSLRKMKDEWEATHEDSVEEVRYYGGFSNIVPNDLCLLSQSGKTAEMKIYSSGKEVQIGSDEWRTDASLNSWDDNVPKVIKLTQNDRLYVQGSSMSSAGGEKIFYAIMKDEAGELFYARAEQMRLKIPCGFLNSSERDVDGFCLKIPMWDLSIGKYEFFFVEIDADGEMYCSPIMGNVEIGE